MLYFVTGPVMTDYSGTYCDPPEPPEIGRPCLEVEAASAREARMLAARSKEFRDLVRDARSDNRNPFALMVVDRVSDELMEHWEVGHDDEVYDHPCPLCDPHDASLGARLARLDRKYDARA